MQIVAVDSALAVVEKAPGEECEHQLPSLLTEELGGTFYPVHRLDRAVGGLMVYARTEQAAADLSRQMAVRRFCKEYLAAVRGLPEPAEGELHDLLFKDRATGKAYVAKKPRRGVKEASLNYQTLETVTWEGESASLVKIQLQTGRFHQIRVQFASRGMPLLGDGKYGSRVKGCTVALYSCTVAFTHPQTGERTAFSADPPHEFPWDLFEHLEGKEV